MTKRDNYANILKKTKMNTLWNRKFTRSAAKRLKKLAAASGLQVIERLHEAVAVILAYLKLVHVR